MRGRCYEDKARKRYENQHLEKLYRQYEDQKKT